MKLFKKNYDREGLLHLGLIVTFAILYVATAFVSFYHAITFFHIANAIWLSIILSFVAEIGQASVLFSILLTDNRNKFLPWVIMIILTSLQVIGNVVSSFDWIVTHNDAGLENFKRSILFAVQTDDPEMFRIIVAWISGALLPVISLSMTALVAQNIDLRAKKRKELESKTSPINDVNNLDDTEPIPASVIVGEVSKIRPTEEELEKMEKFLSKKSPIEKPPVEEIETEKENEEIKDKPVVVSDVPFEEPNFNSDIIKEEIEGDFGSVNLTNEKPDDVPTIELEKVVTPIAQEVIESTISKEQESPPSIEEKPQPLPTNPITQEQLDRIRQIARENLKKK